MRKDINKNSSDSMIFSIDLFLIRSDRLPIKNDPNTINLKTNAIFNDVPQLIIQPNAMKLLSLQPFKFSGITTECSWSDSITRCTLDPLLPRVNLHQ